MLQFNSRISGWPTYILVGQQVKNIGLMARSPNFSNAESWLRILYKEPGTGDPYKQPVLDVISYDRDSSMFKVALTNKRKVNSRIIYDAAISMNGLFVGFDASSGLYLSSSPTLLTISTTCNNMNVQNVRGRAAQQGDDLADGGLFNISDGKSGGLFGDSPTYAMITMDSKQQPVLGTTDNPDMASGFTFSWTGFPALKSLLTLFLKARYYIDHPKLVSVDSLNDIKQVYSDIGQMIIKEAAGTRIESIFYRDGYGHFQSKDSGKTLTIQEKFDAGHFNETNGLFSSCNQAYNPQVSMDNYRHMYPPFAIPPSTVVDRFTDVPSGLVSQSSNQGVDYQRAVTNESSDAAFNSLSYDNAVDTGIVRNAQKVLLSASIQPSAWDKVQQAVSPVGGFDNVWPCVVVISGNNIGVNLDHPVFSGSMMGTQPMFFKGPNDAYTREKSSTGVCILENPEVITNLSDVPAIDNVPTGPSIGHLDATLGSVDESFNNIAGVEHMCPSGNSGMMHYLILIILVIIIAMTINEVKKECMKEKNINISNAT